MNRRALPRLLYWLGLGGRMPPPRLDDVALAAGLAVGDLAAAFLRAGMRKGDRARDTVPIARRMSARQTAVGGIRSPGGRVLS